MDDNKLIMLIQIFDFKYFHVNVDSKHQNQ